MKRRRAEDITFVQFRLFSFGSDEELIGAFGSLAAAEREWLLVRETFLERWNLWGRPQAWWRFEPEIPGEIRTGPPLILTEADAEEWSNIDMARRRYLIDAGIDPTPDLSEGLDGR